MEGKIVEAIRWLSEMNPVYFTALSCLVSVGLVGVGSAAAIGLKAFSDFHGPIYPSPNSNQPDI